MVLEGLLVWNQAGFDESLLQDAILIAKGDRSAESRFFERPEIQNLIERTVRWFIRKRMLSIDLLDDLVGEGSIGALKYLRRYRVEASSPNTWAMVGVVRSLQDWQRRNRSPHGVHVARAGMPTTDSVLKPTQSIREDLIVNTRIVDVLEHHDEVEYLKKRVGNRDVEILFLRLGCGMELKHIAKKYKLTPSAISYIVSRSSLLKKCREALQGAR
jgi:RNA polymerase sigma factor (sigma-70 family)